MAKTTIFVGTRAVVINNQDGYIWANLYVNTQNGIEKANITTARWVGKTMSGAKRWAEKQLSP